jgi:hypothetical protein
MSKPLAAATPAAGNSAGGLATYWHMDELASMLPAARVVAAPDSGFFFASDPNDLSWAQVRVSWVVRWGVLWGGRRLAIVTEVERQGRAVRGACQCGACSCRLCATLLCPLTVRVSSLTSASQSLLWMVSAFNATSGLDQTCITARTAAGLDPAQCAFPEVGADGTGCRKGKRVGLGRVKQEKHRF